MMITIRRHLASKLCTYCQSSRYLSHSSQSSAKIVSLTNRSIVQVHGRDSTKLLQGLVTNDLNLLRNGKTSMYSMMLNVNGRIMYDLMLYKGIEEHEYLVECDTSIEDSFIQLMKTYKLRSKVKFKKREDLGIFSIFNCPSITDRHTDKDLLLTNYDSYDRCFDDPRLPQFGARVLSDSSESSLLQRFDSHSIKAVKLGIYDQHRYHIGLSEGVKEVGEGIPLEHNLVWLNGVSFTKGCYIGQELVARTHHVGVIRKRIMPLQFHSDLAEGFEGSKIINEKGRGVGKVIGHCGNVGIGLMRLREVLNTTAQLYIRERGIDVGVTCVQPEWWPALTSE